MHSKECEKHTRKLKCTYRSECRFVLPFFAKSAIASEPVLARACGFVGP
jgi:hypothetical protein